MRRRGTKTADLTRQAFDEQEFLAVLTDCALPTDVARVFDEYRVLGQVDGEALVVVHKALLRR